MSDIVVGFNGHCKDHPSHGFVIKPEPPMGESKIHACQAAHTPCGRLMFGKVEQLHCATGHMYRFIDVSKMIHDPFTQEEDDLIAIDESRRILGGL